MIDYSKRLPLQYSMGKLIDKKINSALQNNGEILPCSVVEIDGAIVTVSFQSQLPPNFPGLSSLPQVQMPLAGAEYIRYPIKVGDKGLAMSANVSIGIISGLGNQSNGLIEPGNLSSMVFFPIGNVDWADFDPQSLTLYASATGALIKISPNTITLSIGGTSLIVASSGVTINGNLTVTGTVTGQGTNLHTHTHGGVQTGGSNTGAPN